jgi:hypothetical protein
MQRRSFTDKLKNNRLVKFLRNKFSISPIFIDTSKINSSGIISDSFIWRTDNDYETVFKFSDIPKLFLQKNQTKAEIVFYDSKKNFLKKIYLEKLKLSNSINIDKNFMNGFEGYGFFHIFYRNEDFYHNEKTVFSNRCYLGFSKNGEYTSFVHGNTYVYSKSFDFKIEKFNFVNTSFFKKQKYRIQNSFKSFDYSELFFTNPTDTKIYFSVNENNYSINGYSSLLIKLEKVNVVEIISNCYWLRPIVFNYKNNFFDVYHG